jgi:hypothetical protein
VKWAALAFLLGAAIALAGWLRSNPRELPNMGVVMGFLPFIIGPLHFYMAIVSWSEWPGYVKGIEFSVLDACALSLFIALPRRHHKTPFRIPMAIYFIASLFSVLQSAAPMASLFYCWQLLRVYCTFYVVARACLIQYFTLNVLKGLAAGLILEAFVAAFERFILGDVQASGTEAHQNTLGLISHLIVFPMFALLLAKKTGWLPMVTVLAAVVVEIATTSRATLGLAVLGYLVLFLASALREWTRRKTMIICVASVLAVAMSPLVILSFNSRFAAETGLNPDYDERAAFEKAASMMLEDHPLGVGVNEYVVAVNTYGYNNRAGVVPVASSLGANVHNVYKLVAAESGYFGLSAFLILLSYSFYVAISCGWRCAARDQRGDLLLGIATGFIVFCLHCRYEWVFVTFQLQYVYAIDLGLVAGISQQLGYWQRKDAFPARGVVEISRPGLS